MKKNINTSISEKLLREKISSLMRENKKLKNTLLKKLLEGDELPEDDDTNDEEDSSPEDDKNNEEEDKEQDAKDAAQQMSDNVLQNLNVPKNLVLDDGTQTNIALDSNQGGVDVSQDMDRAYIISFGHGNWNYFTSSAKEFSSKVTIIRQTVTPLLEKAFIELIGNSGGYDRISFNASAGMEDDKFRVTVEYHYQVNLYIVTDDDNKAKVMHDQGYIYQTLSQIPNLKINSTKIDTDTGNVTVIVTL